MKNYTTTWTENDFKAYIMLYCALADYYESPSETKLIKSLVGKKTYEGIHIEFDNDNDFERIQKIKNTAERFEFSSDKTDKLFSEIRKLFMADGDFSILEKNIYAGLKHLIK